MVASFKPAYDRAFTLLEVVLAISLTSVVIALLMTAVNQFMIRIDSSQSQVQTAQLARSLLNKIAYDLRAVRFANSTSESPTGTSTLSDSKSAVDTGPDPNDSAGSDDTSSDSNSSDDADTITMSNNNLEGIVGTETELRISRSGTWHWQRLTEQLETQATGIEDNETYYAMMAQAPQTVRYFIRDGDEVSTARLAAAGVEEKPAENIAGLCRQWVATDVARSESSGNETLSVSISDTLDGNSVELLAPEVIDVQFAFSYGSELYDQWDTSEEGKLPSAVEIRLTLLKQPDQNDKNELAERQSDMGQYSLNDTVEFIQVVKLPDVQALQKIPVAAVPTASSTAQQPAGNSTNAKNNASSSQK